MAEGQDGLFSKMPKEFDRLYGNLPESYVASHALVAMLSARLEWLTGALVNNAASALGWPESESGWPYKFSARLRWLRSALDREGVTEQLRELGSTFLNTAERVNAARNDILHSAILGHASDGRLYVARVTTDRKGNQLRLEEGVAWTTHVVGAVAMDLVQCEKQGLDFGQALVAHAS